MTPFQVHRSKWIDCQRCPLHEKRNKVCLVRGQLPAQVLFVGEAPGHSEDSLGVPFVGPAGKLLDKILDKAVPQDPQVTYALTNLVGCIPLELASDGSTEKASEPDEEAIAACRPRLVEIARIVKPKLVVAVGKLAGKHLLADGNEFDDVGLIEVIHPAAILRSQPTSIPLLIQRTIVQIRSAIEKYITCEQE